MQSHYRMHLHQRDEEDYEQEDYDEYEEEVSEEEEEEEEKEAPMPSKEQQDFLKLREQLKEKFRQKLKKQTPGAFGHLSSDKKRTATNDKFGSFFGPSQPVIASRVIDESRSIRETQHIVSRIPSASSGSAKGPAYTSSDKKTVVQSQQPKVINEVKKKAQTLKDMRDYSFLLSDDADFPDAKEQKQPARKVSVPNSDGRSVQAPAKSKPPMGKPARPVSNGHGLKLPASNSINKQSLTRPVLPVKGPALSRPKPTTTEPRKVCGGNAGNFSNRPVGHKTIPSKVPAQTMGTSKPSAKAVIDPSLRKKPQSAVNHSSAQKSHYSEQRRSIQGPTSSKSLPSSKPQSSKQFSQRDSHEESLKKPPMKRRFDDDEDGEDAIGMIRKMFGYNPKKYVGVDDDVSDMEADFREIQKEERRSLKIAKEEDEEQLRLIEEEERRERMRKKQKLKR